MDETPEDSRDALRDRLQDAAAGDHALRQLRRRYDLLREDYAALLNRLSALESRLREAAPGDAAETTAPEPLTAQIRTPLGRLRDQYLQAIAEMQNIVAELDDLAHGRMKSQRAGEPRADRGQAVRLEISGGTAGTILDFQERLSAIPGVLRVSIEASERDRATFTVELGNRPHAE